MFSRSSQGVARAVAQTLLVFAVALTVFSSPARAEIWGIKTQAPFSEPPSTLFHFAEDGGSFTAVAEITFAELPVDVDGLAVDAEGTLYAFIPGDASAQLVTIDPVTAVASAVGIVSGREIRGATFTPAGKLIGIDSFASVLVEIDPDTGQEVGSALPLTLDGEPVEVGNGTDLAVDGDGVGVLCLGTIEIYEVDLLSGAMVLLHNDTEAGEDGFLLFGAGLAFPEDAGDQRLFVYDVNADEDIFAYETTDDFDRTLVYPDIIGSYNAGRGDLASFPGGAVAVPDDHGAAPARPRLLPSFPNPFNPRTTIAFSLPRSQQVVITVHDLGGRQVATIANRAFAAGKHALSWNGLDARGRALPSGTYLLRLQSEDGVESRKVSLVR